MLHANPTSSTDGVGRAGGGSEVSGARISPLSLISLPLRLPPHGERNPHRTPRARSACDLHVDAVCGGCVLTAHRRSSGLPMKIVM